MRNSTAAAGLVAHATRGLWLITLIFCAAGTPLAAPAARPQTAADAAAEAAAEAAASHWLALVDAGKYDQSWAAAASYLRQMVAKADWASSVARVRALLGPLRSRQVESAYATSYLPDAPSGHYVVIHYASRFANKPRATETITAIEESAGRWRVVGYYID